jgi:hypothetical protein
MTLGVKEKGMYFRCPSAKSLEALSRGVAKFLPSPVSIFILRSDEVSATDAAQITAALHEGQSVVLAARGPSELLGELANQWDECTRHLDGTTYVYSGFVMRAVETAGFLATVHALDQQAPMPRRATVCRVPAEEVATLETLGNASLLIPRQVG